MLKINVVREKLLHMEYIVEYVAIRHEISMKRLSGLAVVIYSDGAVYSSNLNHFKTVLYILRALLEILISFRKSDASVSLYFIALSLP